MVFKFLRNELLLNISSGWSLYINQSGVGQSHLVHTFLLHSVIYVHWRWGGLSVLLSHPIILEPLPGLILEMFTESLVCLGTGIQPNLQALPPLEKGWNYCCQVSSIWNWHGYNLPVWTSFFQFEWFMCASRTSCLWFKDIPRRLLEILFNGAHKVSIISPSTCFAPGM